MTTEEKLNRLKEFQNEGTFRNFLIDLLKKHGFKNVVHTHRYGSPEQGKDIIAKFEHGVEGEDWYAFVVKKGRISGGTNEIETIKNQIKQSFEYSYQGPDQKEIKINKVKVVTNENFTNGAQQQLATSPDLKVYNNFTFWWNESLIELIDKHYPDYWLPGDSFAKEYSKNFVNKLTEEIGIRELSIRKIDDRKIKKLMDIFIEPKLTINEVHVDDATKEKSLKRKAVHINSISSNKQNVVLIGDQGSGKTKILNTIACNYASPEQIHITGFIPVRLKAPAIRDADFNLPQLVELEVKELANELYHDQYADVYRPLLFIDDFDLINREDRDRLSLAIQSFCKEKNSYYTITYRRNEFNYDSDVVKISIHNFNLKQVESFVIKYFEGTSKGEHFVQILRESDLLAKLPTTPLTITLISLLYDENNFEIPATLSDIYNDFTGILLGKLDVRNNVDLLALNLKRRIFTSLALKMLDEKIFEYEFSDFRNFVNLFLESRGYSTQSDDDLNEIIINSSLLYKNESDKVGFKQVAFVEFLASLEIYHNARDKNYDKLVKNFNDVNWQNTAIFYAGHSKELEGMIDDVIAKSPANNLSDWFIVSGGLGYLAQALYQTTPQERKKLVFHALELLCKIFPTIKKLTEEKGTFFSDMPLPLVADLVNFWFSENFKSITLKSTLIKAFEEIKTQNPDSKNPEFENNFKLLLIASTLMNPYIGEGDFMNQLVLRESFMSHPLLPISADIAINVRIAKNIKVDKAITEKLEDQIKRKKFLISSMLKEPAYRFNEAFKVEENETFKIESKKGS